MAETLLEIKELKKHYPIRTGFREIQTIKALNGISLTLEKNETLGVVGESGCGKSTLAKVLMKIEKETSGQINLLGKSLSSYSSQNLVSIMQMIFQDPYSSLNPRHKAWQIVSEPLLIQSGLPTTTLKQRAIQVMRKVGLRPEYAERYPHMFSGGQRQRLGIARALITRPQIIICDEPVSALDISIQAQILNLLMELQESTEISYIFISHDLSVIQYLADQVLVMYLGKIVELSDAQELFKNPLHPYTKALLASIPQIRKKKRSGSETSPHKAIKGELPSPLNPPAGCAFHKRCPIAQPKCSKEEPSLSLYGKSWASCHYIERS